MNDLHVMTCKYIYVKLCSTIQMQRSFYFRPEEVAFYSWRRKIMLGWNLPQFYAQKRGKKWIHLRSRTYRDAGGVSPFFVWMVVGKGVSSSTTLIFKMAWLIKSDSSSSLLHQVYVPSVGVRGFLDASDYETWLKHLQSISRPDGLKESPNVKNVLIAGQVGR